MKRMKYIGRIVFFILVVVGIIALVVNLWIEYGIDKSNPQSYSTIGEIPTPEAKRTRQAD